MQAPDAIISAPHFPGTDSFRTLDMADAIAAHGSEPATITVVKRNGFGTPSQIGGTYAILSAQGTFIQGCSLVTGTDANYQPGDYVFFAGTLASGGGGGSGTVGSGTAGQLAYYSGSGTSVAGTNTGLVITQHTSPITTDTDGSTITFNLGAADWHSVTLGGNRTLALSNASVGQQFTLRLQQAASGGPYTPTWFAGITWFTSTFAAPAFPTTASGVQVCTFKCTSSNTYDGFLCGNSST